MTEKDKGFNGEEINIPSCICDGCGERKPAGYLDWMSVKVPEGVCITTMKGFYGTEGEQYLNFCEGCEGYDQFSDIIDMDPEEYSEPVVMESREKPALVKASSGDLNETVVFETPCYFWVETEDGGPVSEGFHPVIRIDANGMVDLQYKLPENMPSK